VVDIICLSSWHGVGGAQMNAAMLVNEFEKRGYIAELSFVFNREPEVDFGVRETTVLADDSPKNIKEWFNLLRSLKQNIYQKKPQAIFGFHPFSNVLGALVSSISNQCSMLGTQRNPSESQGKVLSYLEAFVGRFIYRKNICVSQAVYDSYNDYSLSYKTKLQVIHNGTPPLPEIIDDQESAKNHFNMSKSNLILGCLGRLHEQKNVEFALDVIAKVDGAVLYIAGTGPLEGMLREKVTSLNIENKVFFLGSLHGEDIPRFYRALDVLLFPSRFEGFGRVLIEALSEGVIVVAHNIPVVKEVASEAAIKLPLEPELWAMKLNDIIAKPNNYIEFKNNGIARAQNFTVSKMASEYLKAAGLPETKNEK
jgi:glycosyltransferase involved in cell wall biosynthesis